jgi:hypothetical protein
MSSVLFPFILFHFIFLRSHQPSSQGTREGEVIPHPDYKFFMHRHWSLYESMQYSTYLVVNFQMWKGFKRLEVWWSGWAVDVIVVVVVVVVVFFF